MIKNLIIATTVGSATAVNVKQSIFTPPSSTKVEQPPMEKPTESCQELGPATNVQAVIADGVLTVTFDEPRTDAFSTISNYSVLVQGGDLDETVICTASPCVATDIPLVSEVDYVVQVIPEFAVRLSDNGAPASVRNQSVRNCSASASQDLFDAIVAKDDDAALKAMECPVDLNSAPLKLGFEAPISVWAGCNALTRAIVDGMAPTVERLIEVGADVWERIPDDTHAMTTLDWACWNNKPEVMDSIIEGGMDVNYVNTMGVYNLSSIYWCAGGNPGNVHDGPEAIYKLCELGADFDVRNSYGVVQADWASNVSGKPANKLAIQECRNLNSEVRHA